MNNIKEYLNFLKENGVEILASKEMIIEELKNEVANCRRCSLCNERRQAVFGEGNPNAIIVFIGEAPGFQEDIQGRPFVGRAGELLTSIIEKGMKLTREEVYICNIIKCRPPENRDPFEIEIIQCETHLIKQLNIIQPKIIVALGKYAAQTLLRTTVPITKLRGNWFLYNNIKFMPTYHPAYLLRNPGGRREVWEDIQKIMKEYNNIIKNQK